MRRPSAFLPLAMSLGALAMVLVHWAMFGIVPEADEGTPAHIFQLLMVAQAPLVMFFALKWLPREPRPALAVLGLQVGSAIVAVVAVGFLA